MPESDVFKFKQFEIAQDNCSMKVGTDGILLGAWARAEDVRRGLDIGTGTGLIALMMAQRYPSARIDAVEIDERAFEEARKNAEQSPWSDRIRIINESIQDYAHQCTDSYDMIVSNPPFFSGGTFSLNDNRNNVRQTIKLPHGDLLRSVQTLLNSDGSFSVVLPKLEGLRFAELAISYNLFCSRMTEVFPMAGKSVERLLLEFGKKEKKRNVDQLIIYESGEANDYTADFKKLTGEFYL